MKYPIGNQDFKKIREEGFIYIDKTRLIFDLVKNKSYVFLTRPRRFGKSLLLSTIKAYFEGKKELFAGLAISELEKDWCSYPVLHLEMSRYEPEREGSLEAVLEEQFQVWEELYEVKEKMASFSARFARIIRSAYKKTGKKVVILVDEYDNLLINTLNKRERH